MFFYNDIIGIQFPSPNNKDINDPISDKFYDIFCDIVQERMHFIYEEALGTLATDLDERYGIDVYTEALKLKNTNPLQIYDGCISILF